jgi:hypothetical protein
VEEVEEEEEELPPPPPPCSPGDIIPTLSKEQCASLITTFGAKKMALDAITFGKRLKGRRQATAPQNPALFARAGVQKLLQRIVDAIVVLGNQLVELDRAVIKTICRADRQPLHADSDKEGYLWGSLTALTVPNWPPAHCG